MTANLSGWAVVAVVAHSAAVAFALTAHGVASDADAGDDEAEGVTQVIFGDLFLQDVRRYREEKAKRQQDAQAAALAAQKAADDKVHAVAAAKQAAAERENLRKQREENQRKSESELAAAQQAAREGAAENWQNPDVRRTGVIWQRC